MVFKLVQFKFLPIFAHAFRTQNHYYYGPRKTPSRNTTEVRSWVKQNESALTADPKAPTKDKEEHIREYGKSEMARAEFNKDNPDKKVTHDEFIQQQPSAVPVLTPA